MTTQEVQGVRAGIASFKETLNAKIAELTQWANAQLDEFDAQILSMEEPGTCITPPPPPPVPPTEAELQAELDLQIAKRNDPTTAPAMYPEIDAEILRLQELIAAFHVTP
jgi:hypothetical protein